MIKMKKKIADFDRSIFVRLVQIGRFVADELTSKNKNNDRSNHTGLYAYNRISHGIRTKEDDNVLLVGVLLTLHTIV